MARRARAAVVGDLFLIPQPNGKYTLGQILAFWPDTTAIVTLGLFKPEMVRNVDAPTCARIVQECSSTLKLIAVVSTGVGPIRKGAWPIIGAAGVSVPPDVLPTIPYRTGSGVGGTIQSAPLVETLIAAYRGLVDWDSRLPGRPGYLRSLLFEQPTHH
jgi:hypothetical protein